MASFVNLHKWWDENNPEKMQPTVKGRYIYIYIHIYNNSQCMIKTLYLKGVIDMLM